MITATRRTPLAARAAGSRKKIARKAAPSVRAGTTSADPIRLYKAGLNLATAVDRSGALLPRP